MKKWLSIRWMWLKQAWYITLSRIGRVLSAVYATVMGLLSIFPYITDILPVEKQRFFLFGCTIICIVVLIGCLGCNIVTVFRQQGVMKLYENGNRAFYLSIGGYEETMQKILGSDKLLRELNEKKIQTMAFAMGMDATARLGRSTTKGVLGNALNLLKDRYGISADTIQKKIDAKLPAPSKKVLSLDLSEQLESQMDVPLDVRLLLVAQTREKTQSEEPQKNVTLAYGDCLLIGISEELKESDERKDKKEIPMDVRLLLVANSKHTTADVNEENRDDHVHIEDARKTVVDLFQYANEHYIDCVVVGAMGTNQGKAPYAPVLDTIITAYEWCQRQGKGSCPRVVVLSVREWDIKNHELSLAYIVNRVRSTLKKLD